MNSSIYQILFLLLFYFLIPTYSLLFPYSLLFFFSLLQLLRITCSVYHNYKFADLLIDYL